MRRGIQVWRTPSDGLFYTENPGGANLQFVELPKKRPLVDSLNSAWTNYTSSFVYTDLSATYPGFDSGGNPIDIPGTVIDPGQPIVTGIFDVLQLVTTAFGFLGISDSYNAKENGDGPGAIITPTSRSTTKTTKKSDFSGATTLYEGFLALSTLQANLIKARRIRDAGIVAYAIAQVSRRTWTIIQAFKYLITARIIST